MSCLQSQDWLAEGAPFDVQLLASKVKVMVKGKAILFNMTPEFDRCFSWILRSKGRWCISVLHSEFVPGTLNAGFQIDFCPTAIQCNQFYN